MAPAQRASELTESLDQRLRALAATQSWIVSRDQLLELGFSSSAIARRVESGAWFVVFPGVYVVTGAPPDWRQQLMAGTYFFKGAVVSHRSAAALWRMPGFYPEILEFSGTSQRQSRVKDVLLHRVGCLDQCDVQRVKLLPVTTPGRTLFDLASTCDEETLEIALDHCLNQGMTSLPRLRWTLQRLGGRGRRGTATFARLLEARPKGYVPTQSPLETRVARRVLRILEKEGLPCPVRQHVITDKGKFVARVDFAYPHAKVIVEAQSVKHHAGRRRWESDMRRFAHVASIGWRVLPLLYDDTGSNVATAIERIRRAIDPPKLFP